MFRTKAVLLIVGVLFALHDNVLAAEENPNKALASAAQGFVDSLKLSAETLGKHPAKVNPSKWPTIKAGALELKNNAHNLRGMIALSDRSYDELGVEHGRLQARLTALEDNFSERAKAAESQASTLQEPLRSVVIREKAVWGRWAETAAMFSSRYGKILQAQEKRVAELKLLDPVLLRMEEGAADVAEMAEVGEKLSQSSLDMFAEELNKILERFDSLSKETRDAIDQADPTSIHKESSESSIDGTNLKSARMGADVNGQTFAGHVTDARNNVARIQESSNGRTSNVPNKSLKNGDHVPIHQNSKIPHDNAVNK